eukprot:6464109-Amphidinium_carterae.1
MESGMKPMCSVVASYGESSLLAQQLCLCGRQLPAQTHVGERPAHQQKGCAKFKVHRALLASGGGPIHFPMQHTIDRKQKRLRQLLRIDSTAADPAVLASSKIHLTSLTKLSIILGCICLSRTAQRLRNEASIQTLERPKRFKQTKSTISSVIGCFLSRAFSTFQDSWSLQLVHICYRENPKHFSILAKTKGRFRLLIIVQLSLWGNGLGFAVLWTAMDRFVTTESHRSRDAMQTRRLSPKPPKQSKT